MRFYGKFGLLALPLGLTLLFTAEAPVDFASLDCARDRQGEQRTQRKRIEATGCVVKGVEAGCLMVVTRDGTKYNIFAEPKPAVGTWIRIRGTRHDGPAICMEGIPVKVESWKQLASRCPRKTRDW